MACHKWSAGESERRSHPIGSPLFGRRTKAVPAAVHRRSAAAVFVACVTLIGCGSANEDSAADTRTPGAADYTRWVSPVRCEAGSRIGTPGVANGEKTSGGIKFNVRTPSNYDPGLAHPLLVVYAAGGQSRFASEAFTGFTKLATSAGFVVAYAESRSMSVPVVEELGTIPELVAMKWCIDKTRIFLTGHSDGGTVSLALALLPKTAGVAAGIAPSAAGFTAKDLATFTCPAPLPVMVMHSRDDKLFPGWGKQMAAWWASCHRCDPGQSRQLPNGCIVFGGCKAPTLYCEGSGGHPDWPGLNQGILDLFHSPDTFR